LPVLNKWLLSNKQ